MSAILEIWLLLLKQVLIIQPFEYRGYTLLLKLALHLYNSPIDDGRVYEITFTTFYDLDTLNDRLPNDLTHTLDFKWNWVHMKLRYNTLSTTKLHYCIVEVLSEFFFCLLKLPIYLKIMDVGRGGQEGPRGKK